MSLLTHLEGWLAQCAATTIKREKPFIVAITGSVGKSSTRQAVAALYAADERESHVRVSMKSYNNPLGLSLTIFGCPAPGRSYLLWTRLLLIATATSLGLRKTGVKMFILEMGADKPGDLAYLTKIAQPDVSVVTSVSSEDETLVPVHIANYPSLDAVAEEKSTLVRAVKPGGTVILNADDPRVFAMRRLTTEHVVTYGESDGADIRLTSTSVTGEPGDYGFVPTGLTMSLESLNRAREFRLDGVFGRGVAYAVCAAVAVAASLDLGFERLQDIPQHFHPLPGRARIIPGIKFTTLFDDTYNASPMAVVSALRDLASLPLNAEQRRVACLGEMRELGNKAGEMHRRIGAEVAKMKMDLLVACGPYAALMAEGALANGMYETQIKVFNDTPEAGIFLQKWIKPGDVILAKASQGTIDSKGVRMERVIKELMAEPLRAGELLVRQEAAWKRK